MGKALYREYRSRSFDEVIGQDHIVQILKNSLDNDSISHAYLLTGPRGVGKTSVARIMAFAVNQLAYQEDIPHLDIIEIDAASNRRIDEVREIRERVHIAPTSAKYKVYIIDEVHMLTREAFNALLKTLEEPPNHAIFILATTEAHKVPETIVSRCIRLTFKPIDKLVLEKHLAEISRKEKCSIEPDAISVIARHARGSFRDGISLLQQVTTGEGIIAKKDVESMLGIAPEETIERILKSLSSTSPEALLSSLSEAYEFGVNEATLASQLGDYSRVLLMTKIYSDLSANELMSLQKSLLGVAGSPKPRIELELALLGVFFNRNNSRGMSILPPVQEITSDTHKPIKKPIAKATVSVGKVKPAPIIEIKVPKIKNNLDHDIWPAMLDALKLRNNTLYGIARMGQVEQKGNLFEITFSFPFHFKQVSESKNKAIFAEILSDISDGKAELSIVLNTKDTPIKSKPKPKDDTLSNVSNIFGTAEMLES